MEYCINLKSRYTTSSPIDLACIGKAKNTSFTFSSLRSLRLCVLCVNNTLLRHSYKKGASSAFFDSLKTGVYFPAMSSSFLARMICPSSPASLPLLP